MKNCLLSTAIAIGLATPAFVVETPDVLDTYADIAAANYGGSLITAQRLQVADADAGISAILTGMGSLSYGETAGERMRLV